MMKRFFLSAILSIALFSAASAQEYTSGNPAAIRAFEQAVHYYDQRNSEKAIEALNTAISKDPTFVEAYTLQGNVYDDLKRFDLSVVSYKKAIDLKPDFYINTYFSLANAEFRLSKYEE